MITNLPENINDILKPLNIRAHMDTMPNSENYFDTDELYNNSVFKFYSPSSYRSNATLKETDEIYSMATTVFLHLSSGIRCEYHIHESYFGEEYKLGKLFVITSNNVIHSVLTIDFSESCVTTPSGKINFSELRKTVDEND